MNDGDGSEGFSIKFEQLLMTLSMMTLSTECLSYEELYNMRIRAAKDRSAKILISSIRAWSYKKKPPPGADPDIYHDMVDSVRKFRLNYICNVYSKPAATVEVSAAMSDAI